MDQKKNWETVKSGMYVMWGFYTVKNYVWMYTSVFRRKNRSARSTRLSRIIIKCTLIQALNPVLSIYWLVCIFYVALPHLLIFKHSNRLISLVSILTCLQQHLPRFVFVPLTGFIFSILIVLLNSVKYRIGRSSFCK